MEKPLRTGFIIACASPQLPGRTPIGPGAGRASSPDTVTAVDRAGQVRSRITDPVRTKSSEELTGLHITLEWVRAAGLVRRKGNAVVAVKKHTGLVDRPADLLARATRNRPGPDPEDGVRSLSLQGATPRRYRWVCRAVAGSSRS